MKELMLKILLVTKITMIILKEDRSTMKQLKIYTLEPATPVI